MFPQLLLNCMYPTLYINCRINEELCGKCCYDTKMPLTKRDVERIKKIGYPEEYFVDRRGRIPRLKNMKGHCVFLDPRTNACIIYPDRPEGCRLYPLIYDEEKDSIVVDPLCPKAHVVPHKLIIELSSALLSLIDRLRNEYLRSR
ncbi:MAG: YkgJ family cysteine cluster protein [Candidatus Nezhaarchaeales archaeon]|nr:MAG: YkgJ family cysteine cluster protein [Candidatus Nezhaarchaeota archaeon WYZ-LMO7]